MPVIKVWGRGQLTIPASLRKELHLNEETTLSIVKVGDALVLTPKKLTSDKLAKKAQQEMKKSGLTLENLLKELKKQRDRYHKDTYGG